MESDEQLKDDQPTPPPVFVLPTEIPTDIDLVVVDLDQVLYEGKADSLIAPGPLGNFAILPGHTPLFTKLDKGKLIINKKKAPTMLDIEGGIAKITQNKVTILVGF